MQVRWLPKAIRNLDDAAEFIAQDNPVAARELVRRIRDAVEHLKVNPALGRPGRVPGTRELVVSGTPYIVPYRVRPLLDQVEVLRVFHGQRRLPQQW